ncbi:MAG: electron transfer flavoprotein subunit beta/FixA family protein [Negativicutes bacterium]
MRIISLVKQVPGTDAVKLDPETGVMIRTGKDTVINPMDENALAEAIRIKEERKGIIVSALSMGPPAAIKAVREAIATGADDGALVCGRDFAGSDTIATAKALAAAVKKLGAFDIILCGERATDGETGQTAAMLAKYLNIPAQTYVSKFEITADEKRVIVTRTVEGGFERVEIPMPLLISVNKDICDPGFPTLSGKLKAKASVVPVWGLADLDLDKSAVGLNGSPTRVVKIFSPKLSRTTIMDKADGSVAPIARLLGFLNERATLESEVG